MDAEQVYSMLSNRINVEVMIIKNEIKEMKSEFEGKLHTLEQHLLKLEKLEYKGEVSDTESNKNTDKSVSEYLGGDKIETQIAVLTRAFKEEKKYIRLFQGHINRSLEDFKTSVYDLIGNIREEENKDLETKSNNISVTLLRQMDEISNLKDKQIRNSNMLEDVTHQQRKLESDVANAELAYKALKETLNGRKIAFSAYVDASQATKPGDTIAFSGVMYHTGGGFSSSTGTFKCPQTGVYVFYVTLVCESHVSVTNTLTATLKVNTKNKINIVSRSSKLEQYCSEGSNMVIVPLTEGQTVYVVTYGSEASVMKYMSTFSGMLLY